MHHRRGNKSKKVPNVRLRPAQPDAMARARGSPDPSYWDQDSQTTSTEDTVTLGGGSCPRPFKNVVVCATGALDKAPLFKLASELGATTVSAFTDRVTHLVAESHGGAKYVCALDRKIPILLPSWITESHRIWQHGDDVDLAQSVASHRLPVFSGVILCTSGISIVHRTKINKLLTAAGGTYVKALERPVRVTHLLCTGDAETDEMRYAQKFNVTGEADPPIQLVWEEWFWDALEFGGRFDEAAYDVRRPRPERKATPASQPQQIPTAENAASDVKKPEYTMDDEDELAPVQRLPSMTLQLWGSLLKSRGYEVARGGVVLSPGKAQQMVLDVRSEKPTQEQDTAVEKSVLSGFRRTNSFIESRPTAAAARESSAGPSQLPFGRTNSTWNIPSNGDAGPSSLAGTKRPAEKNVDDASAAFTGLRFLLRGETDSATVRKAIEGAGGDVVHGEDADFIIVRLISGSALYLAETSDAVRARYRSECWLERCLLVDRICAPDEHVSFVPLGIPLPVPGAEQITLSFSGLDTSEACWVRRLLETLGITLASAFSRRTTHLLCPSGTGAKYAHALQWGVPVVDMKWLAAMARTGIVPAVHAFLVSPAEAETDAAPEPQTQEAEDPLQPSIPARVASLAVPSQPRRGMSVSPPKIPDHRTKALEESIVSLLGKRSAMQEESEVPLKRGRLYRSRQTSDALPVLVLDGDERGSVFGKAQLLSPVSDEGSDPDEQSLRVLYEDPGQRAEQRRLANLIGESIEGVRDDVPKTPNR
ncbi:hypothetical protein DFH08DRAFT_907203 [Mycena albidolilacea]|uniref:BRCT domain-containing protein n=1 Tax=Mycena albidolilacea TaxID=1033008 RepID=A0AAD6YXC6_9AGAR|nr:hypothetical protein DFH08DRAFT_907203 [Mycena albidolilacea]